MKFTLKETKPTAEVEFEVEGGTLKFTVASIPEDQMAFDYRATDKPSRRIRAALADAIVAWNLDKEDGTPWECNAANKAALLPELVNLPVKAKVDEKGKEIRPAGVPLGLLLFNFVLGPENFLKN